MDNNNKTRIVVIGGLLVASIGLVVSGISYLSTSIDNLQGWELPGMFASGLLGGAMILLNDWDKSKDPCQNRCGRKASISMTRLKSPPVFLGGTSCEVRLCKNCAHDQLAKLASQRDKGQVHIETLASGDFIVVTI